MGASPSWFPAVSHSSICHTSTTGRGYSVSRWQQSPRVQLHRHLHLLPSFSRLALPSYRLSLARGPPNNLLRTKTRTESTPYPLPKTPHCRARLLTFSRRRARCSVFRRLFALPYYSLVLVLKVLALCGTVPATQIRTGPDLISTARVDLEPGTRRISPRTRPTS